MAVSISSTPPRERRTILEGIVDVIIPNHFNDGSVSGKNNGACGGKISSSGSNSGSASSDPYGAAPSSSFLMASLVAPEVIAERFTPAAARDLDSAYLRQFENAFDLFLMQNPALVPGNADTVERLKIHLLRANTERARLKVELTRQMRWIKESNETMEKVMKERLNNATRAKVLRRMELQGRIDRVEGRDCGHVSADALHNKDQRRHRHHSNYRPHQTVNSDYREPPNYVFPSRIEQSSFGMSSSKLPSSNITPPCTSPAKALQKGDQPGPPSSVVSIHRLLITQSFRQRESAPMSCGWRSSVPSSPVTVPVAGSPKSVNSSKDRTRKSSLPSLPSLSQSLSASGPSSILLAHCPRLHSPSFDLTEVSHED